MKKLIFTVLLFTGALTVAAQEHIEDADAKYAADLLKPGTEAPDFVVDSVKNRSLSYCSVLNKLTLSQSKKE